ncbi:MAG TPA: hypothetical protein VH541_05540 [Gaiellaceae bacterium]
MNLAQLKTRVSRTLGIALGTSDDAIDEDNLLSELANEAVVDLCSRTRVNVRDALIPLTQGTVEFDVDDSLILRMHRMQRGTTWLQEQPLDMLDEYGYAWVGYNRFQLGLAGAAGEELHVWYTPTPDPLATDTDDPSLPNFGRIPVNHHRGILNYMCWHAADKAGDEQVGRGERYRVYYEGQDGLGGPGSDLGRLKSETNKRSGGVRVRRYRDSLASDQDSRYYV